MKKIYLLHLLIILVITTILGGVAKLYLAKAYPEHALKRHIVDYISDKYNKAVIFEKATINISGNLEIKNLKISNSDDFNDADILLKTETAVIDIDARSLIKKELKIHSVTFYNAEINLIKNLDSTYAEKIRSDMDFKKNFTDINSLFPVDVRFKNLKIIYREFFKNGNWDIAIEKSGFSAKNVNGKLIVFFSGAITPLKSKITKPATFVVHAECEKNSTFIGKITGSIETSNFDSSYFNDISENIFKSPLTFSGVINNKINFTYENMKFDFNSEIGFRNFGMITKNYDYLPISGLYCDALLSGNIDLEKKNLDIGSLNIKNEFLDITSKLKADRKNFDLYIKSNTIDLRRLSDVFVPINYSDYSGTLDTEIDISYSFTEKKLSRHNLKMSLTDFDLHGLKNERSINIFRNTSMSAVMDENRLKLKIKGISDRSDFEFSVNSDFVKEKKKNTVNKITLRSDSFQFYKLLKIKNYITEFFTDQAEKDSKGKYREIFFNERKEGILASSNDLILDCSFSKLIILNNASVKNVLLKISLINGKLQTDSFNAEGFNAAYFFNLTSNLDSYWPKIDYELNINGFDLGIFSDDADIKGKFNGIITINENYKSNFYKMSQLMENAFYNFNISGEKLSLSGTSVQNRAYEFIKNSQLNSDLREIEIRTFQYNYRYSHQEKLINNFMINSDKLSFQFRTKINSDNFSFPFRIYFPMERSNLQVTFNMNKEDEVPVIFCDELNSYFNLSHLVE